jgi:hypothetical protein
VIYRCESCFDPHLMTEILEYMIVELLGVVNCYLFGCPKMAYYVLPEESLESRCGYVD